MVSYNRWKSTLLKYNLPLSLSLSLSLSPTHTNSEGVLRGSLGWSLSLPELPKLRKSGTKNSLTCLVYSRQPFSPIDTSSERLRQCHTQNKDFNDMTVVPRPEDFIRARLWDTRSVVESREIQLLQITYTHTQQDVWARAVRRLAAYFGKLHFVKVNVVSCFFNAFIF